MAYTPELSQRASATLRRIAWAHGIPMTRALEQVMECAVQTVDKKIVCLTCRDASNCQSCSFCDHPGKGSAMQKEPLKSVRPNYEAIFKGAQLRVCLVREGSPKRELVISSPAEVYSLVKKHVCSSDREIFLSILLTAKNALIGVEIVSIGTLDSCPACPREVFKSALLANAASVIVCHYHPSGNSEPSHADRAMTRELAAAGKMLDMPLADHVIVSHSGYRSLREEDANLF